MKKIKSIFLSVAVVAVFSLACTQQANAQGAAGHIYHMHTWYSQTGLDSAARADRNAVLKEYHEKVTMKNEFVTHSWSMAHYYSDDSREFVTVDEFANWGDIDKANNRSEELERAAWSDPKQRAAFMKKMDSYFTSHKDAIYNAMPALTK
ncbi:MAG: hypothetical protein JJE25_01770 [Bacteroidia bacterium]|nr:hypothetical protein [Bacteroidia bacterium]